MNKILEMRAKRAKLWDAAKAFLDTHRAEDGTMTAEDNATYQRMEDEVINLGKEIERLERQASIDAELNRAVGQPITGKPGADSAAKPEKKGRASDEYREAFWQAMRTRNITREVFNTLQIGTDAKGGYLVPDEYQRTLIDAREDQNIIRGLAHVITTSSGDTQIPVVASKGSASWIQEEAQYVESDNTFGLVTLGAFKLATMIKVSEELLNDSAFDIPAYIAREFARRVGAAEEEAFLTGNGTGKPLGLLAASGGAETGVTAASATAITMDEVLDLYYSLRAPYRRSSVFIMNDATVKALRKLKNNTGDYIWQPSVKEGEPDRLLGRPIYTSAFMPAMAAGEKPIIFGDLSYYWIADRETRVFKRLDELYAATGQVGFLGRERVDGKVILPEAIKVLEMKSA